MIRVIAVCVFRRGGRILVSDERDSVSGLRFTRPLGVASNRVRNRCLEGSADAPHRLRHVR